MGTDIAKFPAIFEKFAYGKSEKEIFDDFLTLLICWLLGERYEDEFLSIARKYSKETFYIFQKLLDEAIKIYKKY